MCVHLGGRGAKCIMPAIAAVPCALLMFLQGPGHHQLRGEGVCSGVGLNGMQDDGGLSSGKRVVCVGRGHSYGRHTLRMEKGQGLDRNAALWGSIWQLFVAKSQLQIIIHATTALCSSCLYATTSKSMYFLNKNCVHMFLDIGTHPSCHRPLPLNWNRDSSVLCP